MYDMDVYLIIVLWISYGIVLRHNNVTHILTTQPVQSTLPQQVHGLQHCLVSGCSVRLGQVASSIFAETLGKTPWLLLVERLEA